MDCAALDQLQTVWELREHVVGPLLQNANKKDLAALSQASPLLLAIHKKECTLRNKTSNGAGALGLFCSNNTSCINLLLYLGVSDARRAWPTRLGAASRDNFFCERITFPPDLATKPEQLRFPITRVCDMIQSFVLKMELPEDPAGRRLQMTDIFDSVELVIGGQPVSKIPATLNDQLALNTKLYRGPVADLLGVAVWPLMFPESLFPVTLIALTWHAVEVLATVKEGISAKNLTALTFLEADCIFLKKEHRVFLVNEAKYPQYTSPSPFMPIVGADLMCPLLVLGDPVSHKIPAGSEVYTVTIGNHITCVGFTIYVRNYPNSYMKMLGPPIIGARFICYDTTVAEYDLVDMAETNWLRARMDPPKDKDGRLGLMLMLPIGNSQNAMMHNDPAGLIHAVLLTFGDLVPKIELQLRCGLSCEVEIAVVTHNYNVWHQKRGMGGLKFASQ